MTNTNPKQLIYPTEVYVGDCQRQPLIRPSLVVEDIGPLELDRQSSFAAITAAAHRRVLHCRCRASQLHIKQALLLLDQERCAANP